MSKSDGQHFKGWPIKSPSQSCSLSPVLCLPADVEEPEQGPEVPREPSKERDIMYMEPRSLSLHKTEASLSSMLTTLVRRNTFSLCGATKTQGLFVASFTFPDRQAPLFTFTYHLLGRPCLFLCQDRPSRDSINHLLPYPRLACGFAPLLPPALPLQHKSTAGLDRTPLYVLHLPSVDCLLPQIVHLTFFSP